MAPYPDYPLPEDEEARLRALERTFLLDSPSDPHLDRIRSLARTTLGMPIALISLVDSESPVVSLETRAWTSVKPPGRWRSARTPSPRMR